MKRLLAVALLLGIALRLFASTLGYNDDMLSWARVANLVTTGRNVYANETPYLYGYGPVWFLILGVLEHIRLALHANLHLVVASVLTAADVGIAFLLVRVAGYAPAIFFALCPVSILITGYHSQVDCLAVFLGLLSWQLLDATTRVPSRAGVTVAGLCMGLSIATKQMFLFFPVWVVLQPGLPVIDRLMFGALSYGIAGLSPVPFIMDPAAAVGFHETVLLYRSVGGGIFPQLVALVMPPDLVSPYALWPAVVVLVGVLFANKASRELPFVYLITLLATSPSMAEQYLTIPVAACALYWRRWQSWLYVVVATAILLSASVNIGALPVIGAHTLWWRDAGLTFSRAQVVMLLLLVSVYYAPRPSGDVRAWSARA